MAYGGIHHLGVAVHDLDEAVATYGRLLGASVEARDEGEGLRAANVLVGGGRVELLQPVDEDSTVGRFVARRGPGMHHVAYAVDDIERELATLRDRGVELIDARPRPGLFGHRVAFAHPDSVHGVLTELVEAHG
jgi:methylmalonyl-CoA/ethylmalonyl-CoA epimerase